MKNSKLLTAGSLILASAMLFAGCAGITHEPNVDVSSLKEVSEDDFFTQYEIDQDLAKNLL